MGYLKKKKKTGTGEGSKEPPEHPLGVLLMGVSRKLCAYAISTSNSCAGPFVLIGTSMSPTMETHAAHDAAN